MTDLHAAASDLALDVALAAPRQPTSQQECLLAYIDRRKRRLRAGLVRASDAECAEIERSTKAVDVLGDVFGRTLEQAAVSYDWPEPTPGGRPWERRQRVIHHQLALAQLLTPPGWRSTIGATLEGLIRAEEEAILKFRSEERQLHQAVLFELRLLLQALLKIESQAIVARRDLSRRMRITADAR